MGQRILFLIEAAAFFAVMGLFTLLGLEGASAVGGWLARSIGPLTPLQSRARRRMLRAMPELSPSEADRILHDMWDNLGRTIAEMPHLDKLQAFRPDARVVVKDLEIAEEVRDRGRGAIWVSAHFANWEILAALLVNYGLKGGVVYRAPNNPYVDRYLVNLRKKATCPVQIPKGPKGVRQIIGLLKEHGHVAMLVDQRMSDGVEVPFFGIPAMTPAAPAQLALRHNVPIVVASLERLKGPRFVAHLYGPIEPNPTHDRDADIKAIMTRVNLILERCIRARPHEWLWLHRRWPEPASAFGNDPSLASSGSLAGQAR